MIYIFLLKDKIDCVAQYFTKLRVYKGALCRETKSLSISVYPSNRGIPVQFCLILKFRTSSMSTLLIDNYDSFTYNLYHLLKRSSPKNEKIDIVKNDVVTLADALQYQHIVVSPGPGIPIEAGNLMSIIKGIKGKRPLLGICLGHQALAECFGGRLLQLPHPIHGGAEKIRLFETPLFKNIPQQAMVARYHSWIVDKVSLPSSLKVIAETSTGEVMAIGHRSWPMFGLQFHPESFVTKEGSKMIQNFYQL